MTTSLRNWIESNGFTTKFTEWYYDSKVPQLPWGKVVYVVHNGKLTAIKFIEGAFIKTTSQSPIWFLHYKMAGEVGGKIMRWGEFNSVYKGYYDSKEAYIDFINGVKKQGFHTIRDGQLVEDFLCFKFKVSHLTEHNVWNHSLVVYSAKCGDVQARENDLLINELYVNENGIFANTDWVSRCGTKVYNTPEGAIRGSRVSEVVEFEDEGEKKEEKPSKETLVIDITRIVAELPTDRLEEILAEIR